MQTVNRFVVRLVLAFALLVVLTSSTAVDAAPTSNIFTEYYDCNLNFTGWKYRGCNSTGDQDGNFNVKYKRIEAESCETGMITISWYQFNGTHWVGCPEPTAPNCP